MHLYLFITSTREAATNKYASVFKLYGIEENSKS